MRERWSVMALAAVLPMWACAAGDAGGSWAGTVRDSAGVQIVENPAEGIWGGRPLITVEEDLRIGAMEGDPDYQFGGITGIGVTSDGEILVLDGQARNLKVYSPAGEYVRTIGRPGNGPGELGMGPAGVLVIRGDTVLVPDLANQRVNLYLAHGASLGSFRLGFESGIPLRWDITDAGAVAQLRPMAVPNTPEPDSMDVIAVLATDGTVLDTLRTIPSGETFSFAGGRPEFHFFTAEPVWALVDASRLLFAVNSDYRISVFRPDGSLERIITKPVERERVEPADQSTMIVALERLWREAGVPPQGMEMLKSGVSFAETFPAFVQFLGGPDGSIWVQRLARPSALPADERDEFNPMLDLGSNIWDVFDAEGRYLGPIQLPRRFQPVHFIGDHVYGIWRDAFDVQYVMRLRINVPRDQA